MNLTIEESALLCALTEHFRMSLIAGLKRDISTEERQKIEADLLLTDNLMGKLIREAA